MSTNQTAPPLAPAQAFLMNQWYVVARSAELGRTPLARRICGVPLALYRRQDGVAVGLDDRCPHRKYPLSRGRLTGDDIECAYHGIRFAPSGMCTLIPAQGEIPKGFGARSYPVIEKSALVFAFMGDPALANPADAPDFFENAAPGWKPMSDYLHIEANWQLVVDNLLDLTHLTFVHKTTLASSGIQENPLHVSVEGDTVRATRVMRNVEPAPIFRTLREFAGNIDRYQSITFHLPSHVHIKVEATPPGVEDDPDRIHHVVLNHLTPETERTTHYFWSITRRIKPDDDAVSKRLHALNKMAFDEDVGILRDQQAMCDTDSAPLVNLAADRGVNEVRRIVRRKYTEEAARLKEAT